MARKLTFEKTQNRSALSEKDVKLVELRQQLTCVNTTPQRAAAEVCATSFNVGVITVNLHNKWRRSVVKYWGWGGWGHGQSGQAIKLFQAPREISFTFHF